MSNPFPTTTPAFCFHYFHLILMIPNFKSHHSILCHPFTLLFQPFPIFLIKFPSLFLSTLEFTIGNHITTEYLIQSTITPDHNTLPISPASTYNHFPQTNQNFPEHTHAHNTDTNHPSLSLQHPKPHHIILSTH